MAQAGPRCCASMGTRAQTFSALFLKKEGKFFTCVPPGIAGLGRVGGGEVGWIQGTVWKPS